MLDPKDGAAAKPSGNHLLRVAVGSIRRSRQRAAIGMDRLVGAPIRRLAIFMSTWVQQGRERRLLHRLGDHVLKDIGVSRRDVEGEIRARWYDK
jgi:uncharacterized protein YjiS (DUF1127 family)